jgi:aryl-alcohol dehydrogenase-like predicted oxidoreductase
MTMPLNHYVTLGRSGLRVSPFCLGAMTFGEDLGWGSSVTDSNRILDRYLERGGNFIDTANAYTRGHSEKIIGDHLGRDPRKRERMVLATKFFTNLYLGDPNGGGASRKAIHAQLHESLRRLQTDYVDLRGWTPLVALQIEYSLLQRTVEGELMPMAQELGLGVTPWSPLGRGALTGKYKREGKGKHKPDRQFMLGALDQDHTYDVVEAVEGIAKELGTTTARVALAWVRDRPGVASTIIGARTMAQLDDNLDALDVRLPPEAIARLDAVSKPTLDFPAEFVAYAASIAYSGTNIHGVDYPAFTNTPKSDAERY